MHQTLPPPSTVVLIARNGYTRRFKSKAEALRDLSYPWIAANVGPHFKVVARDCFGYARDWYIDCLYIMRDEHGMPLTADDFYEVRPKRRKFALLKSVQREGDWTSAEYSGSPVPNVSKRRGGNGYWRWPRTQAERRLNQPDPEVRKWGEPPVRGRRTSASLPSAWDDIFRETQKSWKKQRRTQWKP